jgi:hypothetical protein
LSCNTETTADGQLFETLSDPLSDMRHTWCDQCNGRFPLAEFAWSDTGEKIPDYYARHGARATRLERFLCSRNFLTFSLIFGFVAGAVLGFLMFREKPGMMKFVMTAFVGGIGVVAFGSLKEFFLAKLILRRVCGVKDTRMLK